MNPLTFFIPLLIGAGGNSGSQVTTTITRSLALGELKTTDWWIVLRRELLVALCIGTILGALGFLRAHLPVVGWGSPIGLSLVVGLALPAIVIWAAIVSSLLPLGAKRLGIDPAVMSAPFITTFVDATGLIIYFEIARAVLRG
jgi:magnesium transporter